MRKGFLDFKQALTWTVLVAGLGYFVDLYDITIFGVVRIASLKGIGVPEPDLLAQGLFIYNAQMIGMMVGGLFWGIIADRRGRLSVMFASIFIYSLANFANVFVSSPEMYALCRFVGGLGLAGELGAAVTLVAESLPRERRGLGTTVVATLGMLGIVAAAMVGKLLTWKLAYVSGGVMGCALLLTRFGLTESKMFTVDSKTAKRRGDLRLLLVPRRLIRYLACIAIGVPIYFTTGVLLVFAPELTKGLGVIGNVSAADALLFGSFGLTLGDLLSGLLSQRLQSRKRAVALCLSVGFVLTLIYVVATGLTSSQVYALSFLIGMCVGYWAVLVTMAAEQFGTDIRGTVATSVPNFVRGSAVIAVSGFAWLKNKTSIPIAALTVATLCFAIALLALLIIDETFAKDLNFTEENL